MIRMKNTSVLELLKGNGYVEYPDKQNVIQPEGLFDTVCTVLLKLDTTFKTFEIVYYDEKEDKILLIYTFDKAIVGIPQLVQYWNYMNM